MPESSVSEEKVVKSPHPAFTTVWGVSLGIQSENKLKSELLGWFLFFGEGFLLISVQAEGGAGPELQPGTTADC